MLFKQNKKKKTNKKLIKLNICIWADEVLYDLRLLNHEIETRKTSFWLLINIQEFCRDGETHGNSFPRKLKNTFCPSNENTINERQNFRTEDITFRSETTNLRIQSR